MFTNDSGRRFERLPEVFLWTCCSSVQKAEQKEIGRPWASLLYSIIRTDRAVYFSPFKPSNQSLLMLWRSAFQDTVVSVARPIGEEEPTSGKSIS